MSAPRIGERLLSAASLVRQDACFADIGTDHAYLPVFLKQNGIISSAVCTDINEGPLNCARQSAVEHGFSDCFTFRLTDGAVGLSEMGLTDIAICGMGGEMIARIIEASPFISDPKINLILQPMTRQAHLRRFLAEHGFSVLKEVYSTDSGRYYLTLLANYTGAARAIGDLEAEFGIDLTRVNFSPAKLGYFKTKIRTLMRAARGKNLSSDADSYEARVLRELSEMLDINEFTD